MPFPAKNNISKEIARSYQPKTKKQCKKNKPKKQGARFGFIMVITIVLGFVLQRTCWQVYDYLFIRKIQNASIEVPTDQSFLYSAEKYFANDYFLNTKVLGDIEAENPLMKKMVLTKPMHKLTNELKFLKKQYPILDPGIFIWDFSTGQYVDINADKEFPTASMIKIPILFQFYRRMELGLINPNVSMPLAGCYISEGSGMLQYQPVGTIIPVHNLAKLMIQESDNTATNMILSSIGGINDLNRVLRSWGFSKTYMSDLLPDLHGTNVSTPKDIATMLYNIDNSDFLTLKSRAKIVDTMSHVKNRFLIQAGLPDSAQLIHKSGNIGSMLGDGGVVILPDGRKYVVVFMIRRPWNSPAAKSFIVEATKIIHNSYVKQNY